MQKSRRISKSAWFTGLVSMQVPEPHVFTWPPNHVCMPNHPHATRARICASPHRPVYVRTMAAYKNYYSHISITLKWNTKVKQLIGFGDRCCSRVRWIQWVLVVWMAQKCCTNDSNSVAKLQFFICANNWWIVHELIHPYMLLQCEIVSRTAAGLI